MNDADLLYVRSSAVAITQDDDSVGTMKRSKQAGAATEGRSPGRAVNTDLRRLLDPRT